MPRPMIVQLSEKPAYLDLDSIRLVIPGNEDGTTTIVEMKGDGKRYHIRAETEKVVDAWRTVYV